MQLLAFTDNAIYLPMTKKRGPKNARSAKEPIGPYFNNLYKLRIDKQLTQEEVAIAIGKTVIDISRLENGRIQMTEEYIRPLTKNFDWTASDLLEEIQKEKPVKNETELAVIYTLKVMISMILHTKTPDKNTMIHDLGYASDWFRLAGLPNAVAVMADLLAHTRDEKPAEKQHTLPQVLSLSPPR